MLLGKKVINFKPELSPSKPLLRSTQSLTLGILSWLKNCEVSSEKKFTNFGLFQ